MPKIFNKGQRTIEYAPGYKLKPESLAEVSDEVAAKLLRLYPNEVIDPESAMRVFGTKTPAPEAAPLPPVEEPPVTEPPADDSDKDPSMIDKAKALFGV